MLAIERFGEVTNFKKRGQRFTDFRLRAGDRVIHGVFSGRDQIMVQAHQNGAPVAGGANACPACDKGLFTAFHLGPRAGTYAVNFWILNLEGEQLGEHVRRRIDSRIITDLFANQRQGGLVTVGVVDVV